MIKFWLPGWILLALLLGALLRRWADIQRLPRFSPGGRDRQRRRWTLIWVGIHAAPLIPVLAGILLLWPRPGPEDIPLSFLPPLRPPEPVLRLYGVPDGNGRLAAWQRDARQLGFQVLPGDLDGSKPPDLVPGVWYYPEGESEMEALRHREEAAGMLRAIGPGLFDEEAGILFPLRGDRATSAHRLLLGEPPPAGRLKITGDRRFARSVAPILTMALDRAAVRFDYEFVEAGDRGLPSCGIIRYEQPEQRASARFLEALLSGTVGLTNIAVAPDPEPQLSGLAVNLNWETNARFLTFVWERLRLMDEDGSEERIRRGEDYREEWLENFKGPWAFALVRLSADLSEAPGHEPSAERILICSEEDGDWRVMETIEAASLANPFRAGKESPDAGD